MSDKPTPDIATVQLWIRANLSMAKKARGLTDAQIAEKMGVRPSSVHNYRANIRSVGLGTLIKLAAALDVTPAQLLTEPANLGAAIAIDHRSTPRKRLVTKWRKRPISKMAGLPDADHPNKTQYQEQQRLSD